MSYRSHELTWCLLTYLLVPHLISHIPTMPVGDLFPRNCNSPTVLSLSATTTIPLRGRVTVRMWHPDRNSPNFLSLPSTTTTECRPFYGLYCKFFFVILLSFDLFISFRFFFVFLYIIVSHLPFLSL